MYVCIHLEGTLSAEGVWGAVFYSMWKKYEHLRRSKNPQAVVIRVISSH